MATWRTILTRLRRYLRDPDGLIWTDAELLQYFNDAALEIAVKTGPIVRVETYNYPPEYDYTYLYDWEIDYTQGTTLQTLLVNQASGWVICYPAESAYWLDTEPTDDDGYRPTQAWETAQTGSPADVIPIPLHAKFSKMQIACYDEAPIDPIDEWSLAQQDGWYRTRTGEPQNYWQLDEQSNLIALYPHPSVVWDETEVYEVLDDLGGLEGSEAWLDAADTGVTTDVISLQDTLFAVYEAMPAVIETQDDVPDFARYQIKYVEYATLERAYSADTDGFIPSLRDYWGLRKKAGIEALKKWKRKSYINREHRLGGATPRSRGRHPRLPEHYPSVT